MKSDEEILLERAKVNSIRRVKTSEKEGDKTRYVEFCLFSQRYAIKEKFVSEVLSLKDITSIPGTPPFVMGVMHFRSKILSVINIHKLFNLPEKGLTELNKAIVLDDGKVTFGVVADSISGILEIDLNTVSAPPPNTFGSSEMEYVLGVLPDGLVILKAGKMLKSPILIINQQ